VPLDGSRVAEGALPHARDLAKAMGSELVLLRVLRPRHLEGGQYPVPIEARIKSAHKYLSQIQEGLAAAGIPVNTAVTSGLDLGDTIAKWATEHEVDAIVLMSHGFGRAAKAIFGSVAERLLERSPVPVLVVRATAEVLEEQTEQEEDELDEELLYRMAADA
jgi:nucleotide-binding universal stress UspA family protein